MISNPFSRSILVVDDEELILDFVRLTLKHGGYQVLLAGNAKDALTICRSHVGSIDLALLDVSLPGGGGAELAESLREVIPHLPIIFMTGFADDDLQQYGLDGPNSEVLLKPFVARQLTERVKEVLGRTGTLRAGAKPAASPG